MGWYETVKEAFAIADKLGDVELKQHLVGVQAECVKLAEENVNLRQELMALRQQVQSHEKMLYRDNVYWQTSGEGPYCPKCLDGNHKAARMSDYADWHAWTCPVCECSVLKPKTGGSQPVIHVETEFL